MSDIDFILTCTFLPYSSKYLDFLCAIISKSFNIPLNNNLLLLLLMILETVNKFSTNSYSYSIFLDTTILYAIKTVTKIITGEYAII